MATDEAEHSDASGGKINFRKLVKNDQNHEKMVKNGLFSAPFGHLDDFKVKNRV